MKALFKAITSLFLTMTLGSCSIGFVSQAAYNYVDILWRSEDIKKVLADPNADQSTKDKLALILDAREFAKGIGLRVKKNYSTFATVESGSLAWIVTASRRTAFEPKTWWYPIVGSVPYKGFFQKDDADALAKSLQGDGYETAVRDTVALSTLGWFSDPVLSSITQLPEEQIIETILHELLHTTVWVPGAVDFNETLANFVGLTAAAEFFQQRVPPNETWVTKAGRQTAGAALFSLYIQELIANLTELYGRNLPEDQTLALRQSALEKTNAKFSDRLTASQMYQSVNNAALLGTSLYYKNFADFQAVFDKSGENWASFLGCVKQVAEKHADDPFAALKLGCDGVPEK